MSHESFASQWAKEDAAEANQILGKWLTTLTIGNGTALFGAISIAAQQDQTDKLYLLLPSMWIFLIGVIAASISYAALGASYRYREVYNRLSHADEMYKAAGLESKISQLDIEKADRADDQTSRAAGWLALGASLAFVLGIGIPLGRLTYLVIQGTL